MRSGVAVVVSPLIALMQDQVDALAQLGVKAAFLNSSQSFEEAAAIERQAQDGQLDLLYVAPERLLTERFMAMLDGMKLALFAIDEAHCVSQWGHDFRPEYRQLSMLHQRFPHVPRLALTATADALTRAEIVSQLQLEDAELFIASFDRPNIRYAVVEKGGGEKALLRFLNAPERRGEAGIVYCGSRRKVEETAIMLKAAGLKALPYHAGLTQDMRRDHQQKFLREDGIVMVATIAFGMGIDKPDVRFVAHLDLPGSLEAYYQETGRAGRDGAPADTWLSYGLGDVVFLSQRIDASDVSDAQKRVMRGKLQAMLGYCETVQCRRVAMLDYFGEPIKPCGNCDTCLDPPKTWDGTVAVQKLLSAALRTGQRFGANHLIDVLLGKVTDKIKEHGHDALPTFGVGKDIPERAWRGVIRQVTAEGLLHADAARYGALQVTDKGRVALKGEKPLLLRQLSEKRAGSRRRDETKVALESADMDEALYAALRECRKRFAEEQNVPAYVIFHDATLREMATTVPQNMDELRNISGVGERKLARYGAAFLAVLRG